MAFEEEIPYKSIDDGGSSLHNVEHPNHGAIGDGVADDGAAIESADDAGGALLRSGKIYRVGSDRSLSNPLMPLGMLKPAAGVEVIVDVLEGASGARQWIDESLGGKVKPTRRTKGIRPESWQRLAGDGSTICVSSINRAITAAYEAGGGRVPLAGHYMIDEPIIPKDGVEIYASGKGALLQLVSGVSAGDRQMIMPAPGTTDCTIRGLHVDQQGSEYDYSGSDQCISVNETTDMKLIDVVVIDPLTMAVWSDTPSGGQGVIGLEIRGMRIRGGLYTFGGISLFGYMEDILIDGVRVKDTQDDAIAIQAGSGAAGLVPYDVTVNNFGIRNCNRRGDDPISGGQSTPRGLVLWGVEGAVISNGVVRKTCGPGILIEKSYAPAATAKRCRRISVSTVEIYEAGITPDSTVGVPGHGLYAYQCDVLSLNGVVVEGSRQSGIALTRCKGVTGSDNIAEGNGYAGSHVFGCEDVDLHVISRNNGEDAEPYGVVVNTGVAITEPGEVTTATYVSKHVKIRGRMTDTRAGGAKTQDYGIYVVGGCEWLEFDADCEGNKLAPLGGGWNNSQYTIDVRDGQIRYGKGGAVLEAGSVGMVRKASGTGSIPAGLTTSGGIAHGLSQTPDRIRLTPLGGGVNPIYISAYDGTSLTVDVNGTTAYDRDFMWEADYTEIGTTSWNIPHGLSGAPNRKRVTFVDKPGSSFWVDADATNLVVQVEGPLLADVEIEWEAWFDIT